MYYKLPNITLKKFQFTDKFDAKSVLLTFGDVNDKNYQKKLTEFNNEQVTKLIKNNSDKDANQNWSIPFPSTTSVNLWLVSLLNLKDLNCREWAGQIVKNARKKDIKNLYIQPFIDDAELNKKLLQALLIELYYFDKYKEKKEENFKNIYIEQKDSIDQKTLDEITAIAAGTNLTRDVANEPANILTPKNYAKIIEKEFSGTDVKVKILGKKEMEKLGMGCLLGVAQGSVEEPQLVIMDYRGNSKNQELVSLVGKGVTFDTGGISIKPSRGMEDMKFDMCGSATVVGVMKTLAMRKAKVNVVAAVGLVENMPSGSAMRPGDIIRAMSGKTVEVLNTDAEGRLVLADAMWYVQENYKPKIMIDLATLTGAVVVALGSDYAGCMSNNSDLVKKLNKASEKTEEKIWELPLAVKEYGKLMKSKCADLRNISDGQGPGTITAALFLHEFVKKETKWAHLDIAGTAWRKDKFPTGFGVNLLHTWLKDEFEEK